MEQRIAKIEAHLEKLRDLLLGAHAVFAILRPMNIDEELVARFSRENRGAGFGTTRHVLYWNLVQELVKIVADEARRAPSIHNLRRHLADPQVKARLEDKYSVWASPGKASEPPDVKAFLKDWLKERESQRREEFNSTYRKAMDESAELLRSAELRGMKKVRDQLLAHNDLRLKNGTYRLADVSSCGLKYGGERLLLEKATRVFDAFFLLVKSASFEWEDFKAREERDAALFWRK